MSISKIHKLITKYNTRDPFKLSYLLNIDLIKYPLHHKIKGIFVFDSKTDTSHIVTNSSLNYMMERFIIAHELGHALLHPCVSRYFIEDSTLFLPNKFEQEANLFAAELLINNDQLIDLLKNGDTLEKISYDLNVPKKLLEIKIDTLNKTKFF